MEPADVSAEAPADVSAEAPADAPAETSTEAPAPRRYALTLSDVFGDTALFNPRLPYRGNPVMPGDERAADFLTGAHLGMAGRTPVLCHRGALTPESLLLLRSAGLPLPDVVTYGDEASYRRVLAAAPERGVRYQHVHPAREAPPGSYRVSRALLSWLNNKAHADRLVPARALPRRVLLGPDPAGAVRRQRHPLVLKVASDDSVGGGYGVRICRSVAESARAVAALRPGGALVAEEFVAVRRSWCLNYAVGADGSVRCLGGAEQLTDAAGHYRGNTLGGPAPERLVALGREVVEAAAGRGYAGFAGLDIVETDDHRDLVIDLNFRLNGSTSAVLLRHGSQRPALFRTWRGEFSTALLELLVGWGERRVFTPVASRFPGPRPGPGSGAGGECLVSGVLEADDRDELDALVRRLAGAGLR